jgi:hypothetical protein
MPASPIQVRVLGPHLHLFGPVFEPRAPPDASPQKARPGCRRPLSHRARVRDATDRQPLSFLGHVSHIRWRTCVADLLSDHTTGSGGLPKRDCLDRLPLVHPAIAVHLDERHGGHDQVDWLGVDTNDRAQRLVGRLFGTRVGEADVRLEAVRRIRYSVVRARRRWPPAPLCGGVGATALDRVATRSPRAGSPGAGT